MGKRFARFSVAITLLTALGVIILSLGRATPVFSTAAAPPSLVPAILNGNPISVLYITRSSDTVLVRCYPGFQPSLSLYTPGSLISKEVHQILAPTACKYSPGS